MNHIKAAHKTLVKSTPGVNPIKMGGLGATQNFSFSEP